MALASLVTGVGLLTLCMPLSFAGVHYSDAWGQPKPYPHPQPQSQRWPQFRPQSQGWPQFRPQSQGWPHNQRQPQPPQTRPQSGSHQDKGTEARSSRIGHSPGVQPTKYGNSFNLSPTEILQYIFGVNRVTVHDNGSSRFHSIRLSSLDQPRQDHSCTPIKTEDFFRSAQKIPMKLYNKLVCAVFKKPPTAPELINYAISPELTWESFNHYLSIQPGFLIPFPHRYHESHMYYSLRNIRAMLNVGINNKQRKILKRSLLSYLNVNDIEAIFDNVYGNAISLGRKATQQFAVFYASSPYSTITDLAQDDRKRILTDLILAANGNMVCSTRSCQVKFYTFEQVADALSEQLLPQRTTGEKRDKAKESIKFIAAAKLTSTKVSNLLGKLVRSHPADSMDREMTCHVLSHAKSASDYCGIRESALQLYDKLNCVSFQPKPRRKNPKQSEEAEDPMDIASAGTGDERDEDKPEESSEPVSSEGKPYAPVEPETQPDVSIQPEEEPEVPAQPEEEPEVPAQPEEEPEVPAQPEEEPEVPAQPEEEPEAPAQPESQPAPPSPAPTCGVSDLASRMFSVQTEGILTEARIVGGSVAGTCTTYPWMVRILIPNTGSICGGAILDSRHVLTAAHCLLFTDRVRIFVGDYDRANVEGTEQIIEAAINELNNTALHPEYNFGRQVNDIAVVTLDTPIDLEEICATPLCLDPTFEIKEDMECTVAGWGLTQENDRQGSELMMAASIPTFNSDDCLSNFPDIYMSDPDNQICAGEPDVGGIDTCGGDSGGPLFCLDETSNRWVAVGVVQYGEGCARAGLAGVYADVRRYIPWIISKMTE